MLQPFDEFPHEPPSPVPGGWQENWYLLGWDAEQAAGFSLHLGRIPAADRLAVRACVLVGGETGTAAVDAPLGAGLKAPGLEVEIDPFERWRVSFEGASPMGERVGCDVVVDSLLAPVDWREALVALAASGTERDHYEVGARVTGAVNLGSRSVAVDGLLVRDHTWGVRGYGALDEAWWTPMVFADPAPAYCTGVSVRSGDRGVGTSIVVVDGGEPRVLGAHEVVVTAGSAGPGRYDAVDVRAGAVTAHAAVAAHAHVPYPEWAEGFWLNDAFCTVDWDGRRGFGIVELSRIEPS